MQHFILEQSLLKDDYWICKDTVSGLICIFENEKFNDTKIFTFQYGVDKPDVKTANKLCTEMVEWLKENHNEKIL